MGLDGLEAGRSTSVNTVVAKMVSGQLDVLNMHDEANRQSIGVSNVVRGCNRREYEKTKRDQFSCMMPETPEV